MKTKFIVSMFCILIALGLPCGQSLAAEKETVSLTSNYYWDNRGHGTLSLFYSSNALPYGLAFWGFTDFDSDQKNGASGRVDFSSYFTEARLTKMLGDRFGIQAEYNDMSGSDNNVGRLGIVYKFPLQGKFLMLRLFPLETDGDGGQVSLLWRTKVGLENLFFEGFIDYNFNKVKNRIVTEPQLRYMFNDHFGLTLEYRFNEFLKPTPKRHKGLALGISYKF